MDRESGTSSKYDSGKQLIETFGRGGNLFRYLEPNLSERNNFERQKMAKIKNNETHKEKNDFQLDKEQFINSESKFHEGNSFEEQSHNKDSPFQQIDEISHKINGIIRSISLSCQKRGISSNSKKTLEKCQTVDRLQKLQNKYCNHASEKHFKAIDTKLSSTSHPEKMKKSQNIKKRQKNEGDPNFRKSIKKYQQYKCDHQDTQQNFDDINERIQHINDKITRYEQKMAGYQETYRTNKKVNELYFKDGLKQFKTNSRIKDSITKKSTLEPTKGETTNHYSQSARQKVINREIGKENINTEKQFKMHYSRKQRFFNDKYKEVLQSHQSNKNKGNKDLCESINTNNKGTPFKEEKKTLSKNSRVVQKISANPLQKKFQQEIKAKSSVLQALIKQIGLDQDFRHAKHMFGGLELFDEQYQSQSHKWNKLKEQLENEGMVLSLKQVKNIFMPRDDEIDPFMSVSQSHQQLIYGLIFAYQACENHWKQNIYRGWSFRELNKAGFTSENIDRGKKGHISLEDLTFYINTQVDGFYRNRDLLLIFNRLGSKQNLKYKQMVNQLLSS